MDTDAIRQHAQQVLSGIGIAKRVPLEEISPHEPENGGRDWVRRGKSTKKATASAEFALSPTKFRYLADMVSHARSSIVERNSRLGIKPATGNSIKKWALKNGLVREVTLSKEGRGASIKLLEPTEKLLAQFGLRLDQYPGQGSFLHRYFQNHQKGQLQTKGFTAAIEYNLKGKRADVGYETDDGPVAVEVEFSWQGAASNVHKNLAAGFVRVETYAATTDMKRKIEAELARNPVGNGCFYIQLLSSLL